MTPSGQSGLPTWQGVEATGVRWKQVAEHEMFKTIDKYSIWIAGRDIARNSRGKGKKKIEFVDFGEKK